MPDEDGLIGISSDWANATWNGEGEKVNCHSRLVSPTWFGKIVRKSGNFTAFRDISSEQTQSHLYSIPLSPARHMVSPDPKTGKPAPFITQEKTPGNME